MKTTEFERLFKELSLMESELMSRDCVDKSNQLADKRMQMVSEAEHSSQEFVVSIRNLLQDTNEGVALDAAGVALWHIPEEAVARLEQLAKSDSNLQSTASITLSEWRAGRLKPWWRSRWPRK